MTTESRKCMELQQHSFFNHTWIELGEVCIIVILTGGEAERRSL